MRIWLIIILFSVLFLYGCTQEEFLLCPDGVTQVLDLDSCPVPTPTCPSSCDDGILCTRDVCTARTNYTCSHIPIIPCDGNGVCEQGEFPKSDDCPSSCDDKNICTEDAYNYARAACSHNEITPCCTNNKCESGETFVTCPQDCAQAIDIFVTSYERRQSLQGAYADLTDTNFVYLIVYFKIKNINVNLPEEVDYQRGNGFYYDPFRMRVETDTGKLYNVEYDSDIIEEWLDYTIIPQGNTRGAALVFIIPKFTEHVRLVAYDKFGARMDISEVY